MKHTAESEHDYEEYAAARWRHLVRSAVLLGCTPAEAEDLAQSTLLRCYVQWARVCRAEQRDAYVTRMLINAFRTSRRRRWWGERPTAELPERGTPDGVDDLAQADAVERALGSLSRTQREVLVLRFWSGLSEREIAETLGIAQGTVKSRISRGLARLSADGNLTDQTRSDHPSPTTATPSRRL